MSKHIPHGHGICRHTVQVQAWDFDRATGKQSPGKIYNVEINIDIDRLAAHMFHRELKTLAAGKVTLKVMGEVSSGPAKVLTGGTDISDLAPDEESAS